MEFCLISCGVVRIADSCPAGPRTKFRAAAAAAPQPTLGDCPAGKVPAVCTHASFLLPLPRDGSWLNVCGAAVVRAFAGDCGCCCGTGEDEGRQQ